MSAAAKADSKAKSGASAATSATATAADFKFPDFYHFPPFFTLQPVSATRAKQVALWRDFVLSYVAAHRSQQTYVLADEQKKPLFCNAKIDRKLPLDVCQMLFHDLIQQGYGEWLDAQRAGAVLSWRRSDDWAASLWAYAKAHNLVGNVTTVYDLSTGDDTAGADFHGLDQRLLLRALQVLEKQNRVTLLRGANTAETGVKFLDSA